MFDQNKISFLVKNELCGEQKTWKLAPFRCRLCSTFPLSFQSIPIYFPDRWLNDRLPDCGGQAVGQEFDPIRNDR